LRLYGAQTSRVFVKEASSFVFLHDSTLSLQKLGYILDIFCSDLEFVIRRRAYAVFLAF